MGILGMGDSTTVWGVIKDPQIIYQEGVGMSFLGIVDCSTAPKRAR